MDVVGHERGAWRDDQWHDDHVHTIDIWFSRRRDCWVVERLNVGGQLVGTAHCCSTREDAEDCLAEWLRAHGEAHLTSPGRDNDDPDTGRAVDRADIDRVEARRLAA